MGDAKKTILSRTNANGVKETYEVSAFSFSVPDNVLTVTLRKSYVAASGIPAVQNIQVYYNESMQAEQYVLDPAWDANSTPPKPENFTLDDVSTWGGLTIADIPFVTKIQCSSKMLSLFSSEMQAGSFGERVTETLIDFLFDEGRLPGDWTKEGIVIE